MEPEGLLQCSQDPTTGTYPEPYESISHYFFKIYSTISSLGLPTGLFPLYFLTKMLCVFLNYPMCAMYLCHNILD